MSVVNAMRSQKKKEEEEQQRQVVGQQQKTQSNASKPTGSTSIPKDNQGISRTQKSAASSLRTENNITTSRRSDNTSVNRNTITANVSEQRQTRQQMSDRRGSQRRENFNPLSENRTTTSNLPGPDMLPKLAEQRRSNTQNAQNTQNPQNIPDNLLKEYASKNGISYEEARKRFDDASNMRNQTITKPGQINEDASTKARADRAEELRKANQRQQSAFEAGLTNMGKTLADPVNVLPYAVGKLTGQNIDLVGERAREAERQATEQHPVASALGDIAGFLVGNKILRGGKATENALNAGDVLKTARDDALLNGATKGQALLNGISNAARTTGVNALKDYARTDLALDTLPSVMNSIIEGKSREEVARDAALNVGANVGFNAIGDILSAGKALNDVRRSSNNAAIDEIAQNAARQSEEAARNIDNLAQTIPDAPEEVLRSATDSPYRNAEQIISPADTNKALGNNEYQYIKEQAIKRLTDLGGDENQQLYANLVRSADEDNLNAFNRALSDYREATGGRFDRQLNRLEDAVNGRVPKDVPEALYSDINTNIDSIEDGLNHIGNLEGLSDLGHSHLANARTLLDQYEDAVRNGGNVQGIAADLNRTLGNLNNQAKKVDGYNKVFNQWKGGDNPRGNLYSSSSKVLNVDNLSPEDEAMIREWIANEGEEYKPARPANQPVNQPTNIPNAEELPQAVPKKAADNTIPEAGVRPELSDSNIPEVEEPKQKVSQTYTNTGKHGGGWNEEEYTKYTDPKDYVYETKSEADSVARAEAMRAEEGREAFKERVFKEERVSSEELDGLMMEWRELTEEARTIEANGGDASQLWNESNRVFRKIREQSTNNAQALQSLAKWSRNTPEGMLVEAENIVNGNVKVEKGELQKQLEKYSKGNKQKVEFNAEFQKEFLNLAEEFKKYDPDSREAKDLMGRIGRLVDSQVPKKLSQKVQTWLMDSMLGNFRTLISRNAGGNLGLAATEQVATRPLAAGIDSLVSLKTGKRTQAGFSKQAVGEYLDGMKKGIADEIHDLKTGLHTARTGENTLENAIKSNQHVFQTKILDKFDSLVKNGLSMGDRPFYEATYAQTLGDYYRLRSDMGPDIAALTDDQFKEYAETAAHLNALAAVYQNDSKLAKGMLDLKNAIGQISEGTLGVDVLSQFSMPFVKTPANVIDRAIDYSPVGAIRNAIRTVGEGGINGANFDQNRFVNETARNIIGTGITAGGAGLAYANRMSGSYSDDADEKKAQQDAGMMEYALNVPNGLPVFGGKQVDIGWMPIVGSNLVAGAAAYDAYRNGKGGSDLDNLYAGISAGGNELFGQAAMQGAQRLFGGSNSYNKNESLMDNAKNVVAGGFSQAVPSLARQVAQVADPYKRDVGNSNEGNYELNQILNAIPYLRQNELVPKVDSSGNPVLESQGRDIPSKILEDMILPGRVSEIQFNRLDEEAMALSEETGNKYSYMPKAVRKNVEDDSRKLTNDEWYDYQVEYGKSMTAAGEAMINNELYASIGPTEKEAALQDIYTAVKSSINNKYKERELTGAAKVYNNIGLDAAIDYVIYGNVLTENGLKNNDKNRSILAEKGLDYVNELSRQKKEKADINVDGNTSVTQDEILDYLNKGNYSNEEAQRIWDTYKRSNSKKELKQNANGEWELSGDSKKSSSSTTKNKSSNESSTNNSTFNSLLKAKQKSREDYKNSNPPGAADLPEAETTQESSGGGLNWALNNGYDLQSTQTYSRAKAAGVSDADFNTAWWAADADGNGYMKKAEAWNYASQFPTKEEQQKWFHILYKGR